MTSWTWGADCPGTSAHLLPQNTPAVWPYITGSPDIRWAAEDIARFARDGAALFRINQKFGSVNAFEGDEFDVENGAWMMADMLPIVAERRTRQWSTRIYCTWTSYGELRRVLAEAGTGRSVFFHIADWNVDQEVAAAGLHGDVYAWQWASPSSNPRTVIPGTTLTLAEANADLNVVSTVINTGWQG